MHVISLCAMVCVVAVISVSLRKYNPEYSVLINIGATVLIFLSLMPNISLVIDKFKNLFNMANVSPLYTGVLLKSLGICLAVQFASDSCKDAGEHSLASKIEFAGKLVILSVSLPLFEKIIEVILSLVGVH